MTLVNKIVVEHQSDRHIDAGVIVLQVQTADGGDLGQAFDQGVPVDEQLVGCAGHVAAAGQVDAQGLHIVGAVGLVIAQQQLQGLIVQYHRGVVQMQVAQHLDKADALVGAHPPSGLDLPQGGQAIYRVLQLHEQPLGGAQMLRPHIVAGAVGL